MDCDHRTTISVMSSIQIMPEKMTTEPAWTNLSSGADQSPELTLLAPYQAASVLWKVCSPIILVLGTFGSCMTLVVLGTMPLRGPSMSVFFSALAVSDLVVLYTGLLRRWLLNVARLEVRNLHDIVCKMHMFLVYLCGMTSAWFLVFMTLQRVVSVFWPHRAAVMCTRRKSQVIVVLILLLLIALNAHIPVAVTLRTYDGAPTAECDHVDNINLRNYDWNIYPWIDLVFTSLLPSFLLFVGNCILIAMVYRSVHQAHTLTNQVCETTRRKAASSLTVTLISVSVTYLFLTLPVCVYIIIYDFLVIDCDVQCEVWTELAWTVTNLLWYFNAAINFYLYCLTGTKFRAQCRRLLCRPAPDDAPATATATCVNFVTSKTLAQKSSVHS